MTVFYFTTRRLPGPPYTISMDATPPPAPPPGWPPLAAQHQGPRRWRTRRKAAPSTNPGSHPPAVLGCPTAHRTVSRPTPLDDRSPPRAARQADGCCWDPHRPRSLPVPVPQAVPHALAAAEAPAPPASASPQSKTRTAPGSSPTAMATRTTSPGTTPGSTHPAGLARPDSHHDSKAQATSKPNLPPSPQAWPSRDDRTHLANRQNKSKITCTDLPR
jgi:hypothetical protein